MNNIVLLSSDHCKLCDNAHLDFSKGLFCGLDMQRPEFKSTCVKIDLNKTYQDKIEAINIEYESVLKTKTDTFGAMVIFSIISTAIFILAYVFTQILSEKGYVSTLTIVLVVIGLITLGKVVGPYNTYRTKLRIAQKKKDTLDKITKLYGYAYDIHIEHLKDSLNNIEHKVNLKVTKN